MEPEETVVINMLLGQQKLMRQQTFMAHQLVAAAKSLEVERDRLDALTELIRGNNAHARKAAFDGLVDIGNAEAQRVLIDALSCKQDSCSYLAAEALGKLRSVLSVEALIETISQRDRPDTCRAAAMALGYIGDKRAVPHLIKLLPYGAGFPQGAAVEALGELRHPSAVEPLCTMLTHNSELIRSSTAEALGKIGDPQAVEALCSLLTDDVGQVRAAAAAALVNVADERAVEPLAQALRDREEGIATLAANALAGIGSRNALPYLKARISLFSGEISSENRTAIKYAIATIETATAAGAQMPRAAASDYPTPDNRPRHDDGTPDSASRPRSNGDKEC